MYSCTQHTGNLLNKAKFTQHYNTRPVTGASEASGATLGVAETSEAT